MDDVCVQVPPSHRSHYLGSVIDSLMTLGRGPDPIWPLKYSDTLKHVNPANEDTLPAVRWEYVGINLCSHLRGCMPAFAVKSALKPEISQGAI